MLWPKVQRRSAGKGPVAFAAGASHRLLASVSASRMRLILQNSTWSVKMTPCSRDDRPLKTGCQVRLFRIGPGKTCTRMWFYLPCLAPNHGPDWAKLWVFFRFFLCTLLAKRRIVRTLAVGVRRKTGCQGPVFGYTLEHLSPVTVARCAE